MSIDQVEFYKNAGMLPGFQKVDLTVLMERRRFLYAQLGIHPGSIAGRAILEFGPGSGVNAVAMVSEGPAHYDLVEADAEACREVDTLFNRICSNAETAWTLFNERIEDFDTENRYDFVICEGTIPMEPDPVHWLLKVARFCKPGGVLVITCCDQLSFFTESLRRYFARVVLDDDLSIQRAVELVPVFGPHLATIEGMNRPAQHYITDNYLQPFEGRKPLSIEEATRAIGSDYVLHHCSIPVVQRWVWHKKIDHYGDDINRLGINSYREFAHNLADNRTRDLRPLAKTNGRLFDLCLDIFHRAVDVTIFPLDSHTKDTLDLIEQVRAVADEADLSFAGCIEDYLRALREFLEHRSFSSFGRFESWFGHTQQHVSFVKR